MVYALVYMFYKTPPKKKMSRLIQPKIFKRLKMSSMI